MKLFSPISNTLDLWTAAGSSVCICCCHFLDLIVISTSAVNQTTACFPRSETKIVELVRGVSEFGLNVPSPTVSEYLPFALRV